MYAINEETTNKVAGTALVVVEEEFSTLPFKSSI